MRDSMAESTVWQILLAFETGSKQNQAMGDVDKRGIFPIRI